VNNYAIFPKSTGFICEEYIIYDAAVKYQTNVWWNLLLAYEIHWHNVCVT